MRRQVRSGNYKRKKGLKELVDKIVPQKKSVKKADYFLLGLVLFLVLFGLVMLSSASSVEAFRRFDSTYHFVFRQLFRGIIPGLILFWFFSKVDYHKWEKYSLVFFGLSLLLLVLVFVPGIGQNYDRAQSWIGVGSFSLQPAEIVKLLLVMSFAGWFAYRGKHSTAELWNGLMPFSVAIGLIAGLIILQPDMGTLVVVVTIAAVMYFIAGARIAHLIFLGGVGVAAFAALIFTAPYRAARLTAFINPEVDPTGIGYHINQAFLAVGSGGIFGLGFGQSRQKFAYLPEVMGDSIFAIIAEELGFVFAAALIVLFALFAWRALRMARQIDDDYAKLLIVGIVGWICFQAFFNIGAMVGLLPLTGIPLPFISFGGTAMLSALAAAGILVNISKHV